VSRDLLVELTRRTIAHARAGTVPLADGVMRVPAANYHEPGRWRAEMDLVFRRLPLVVAMSAELSESGDYTAMEVAGVPIIVVRSAGGEARAFVNQCSHRGAQVAAEGSGRARRFTCPYHAWSYDTDGALLGVLDGDDFGPLDRSCHGLTPLPTAERAGLVFASLTPTLSGPEPCPGADVGPVPASGLDIDTFLCGYGDVLDHLGLARCTHVGSQRVDGPGWKVAYDGYLDLYHLPILHRNSFGPDVSNQAIYDAWGPHQRVSSPDASLADLAAGDEAEWSDNLLTAGIWTIFPHTSIASFRVKAPEQGGGRLYMVSTLNPGDTPGSSVTVQHFLAAFEVPSSAEGALAEAIAAQQRFLLGVVRDEDYATGLGIQRALGTGAKPHVLFGRNEAGGQRFHRWVDHVLAADDNRALVELFARAPVEFQP
jgi:phenylpropionate dioxygenase-like ring-hydroxylating dioxygenase large terminal subunit